MSRTRITRFIAFALTMLGAACTGAEAHNPRSAGSTAVPAPPPAPPRAPEQYVVVLDLSGSITAAQRTAMQQIVTTVLRTLSFGDRLVVMHALSDGVGNARLPFVVTMPLPEFGGVPTKDDTDALDATRTAATPRVQALLAGPPAGATDLFATLHLAAQRVHEDATRRSTVVMLSDMLQCTREVCMEGSAPIPDERWVAARKEAGVIPDLRGACIAVIGADATNARGVRVKQFWKRYFAAAGAELDDRRYVHDVTTPGAILCSRS